MDLPHILQQRLTSKCLLGTSDDNGTDVLVLVIGTKSFIDFSEQITTQSIQSLGAVQGDQTNLALGFGNDVSV